MIREALVELLTGDTQVAALVDDRVYPLVVPQTRKGGANLMPCIVYRVQGQERQKEYCGTSRLVMSTVVLDCYATTMLGAAALADAVREALMDFRGDVGSIAVFRDVSLISSYDFSDMEPGLYRVIQTYDIWHEEE